MIPQNISEDISRIVSQIKESNPDSSWTDGVTTAINKYYETGELFNLSSAEKLAGKNGESELQLYINKMITDAIDDPNSPYGIYSSVVKDGIGTPEQKETVKEILKGNNPNNDIPFVGEEVSSSVISDTSPTVTRQSSIPQVEGDEIKERGYARSIRTKTDMDEETIKAFEDEPELYSVLHNKDTKAKADEIYASTKDASDAAAQTRKLLADKDPAALPLGYSAAKELIENGRRDEAVQLIREMSEELTKSGQFSQAAYITMMQNDPITALKYMQSEIDSMNRIGSTKFGKKWKDFAITDEEVKALNGLEPGDTEGIKAVFDSVGKRIQKEYPSTFKEKLVELRHLAMLLNPRTHIRNTGANVISLGTRSASDRVSAVGQNVAHLFDKNVEVTQSLTGSIGGKYKKLAEQVWENNKEGILGIGKYEGDAAGMMGILGDAKKQKQVFKDNDIVSGINKMLSDSKVVSAIDKVMNKITGGRISETYFKDLLGEKMTGSILENLRQFDYYLLGTVEDDPFVKQNFVNRLASYMKAQGIKNIDDVSEEAIDIARMEALKATFKDDNKLTELFSGFKQKTGLFGDMVLPFSKTPANLAMRSYEYSPAGVISTVKNSLNRNKKVFAEVSRAEKTLANATTDATKKAAQDALDTARKQAQLTVSKTMDDLSKNITGTGLIGLGVVLANQGLITKGYSDDPDEAAFQKQQGYLPYAIHVGDQYYTYDWAQPTSIGLIIGTEISNAIDEDDAEVQDALGKAKQIGKSVKNGAIASVDAWFDQSPLQSVQEIMGGGEYSSDSPAENVYTQMRDYPLSFIPSVVGASARANDTTMRNTTDQTSEFNTWKNQAMAKIPGLSDNLPASYDTWGKERKRSDDKSAAFAQFVNPGQLGYNNKSDIDDNISELYESTKDNRVFPHKVSSHAIIKYGDGTEKALNNAEVSNYQKTMGETSYNGAKALVESIAFNNLDNEGKADALNTLYNLADKLAQRDLFNNPIGDKSSYKELEEIYDRDGIEGVADYLCSKAYDSELKTSIKADGLPYNDEVRKAWDDGDSDTLDTWKSVQSIVKGIDPNANANESQLKMYLRGGEKALTDYYSTKVKLKDEYGITNPSDKLIEASMNGDSQTVDKYVKVSSVADKYGVGMSQNVIDAYDNYGEEGVRKWSEADFISTYDYGKTLTSKMYDAYVEGGKAGMDRYIQNSDMAESYGFSYSGKVEDLIDNMGERGLSVYSKCPRNDNDNIDVSHLVPYLYYDSTLTDEEKGTILYSVMTPGKKTQAYFDNEDVKGLWDHYVSTKKKEISAWR